MTFRSPVILALITLLVGTSIGAFAALGLRPGSQPTPSSLPLAAVNGPQKTLVILVDFTDKGNSSSPSQVMAAMAGVNDYYRDDSYSIVSFDSVISPATGSWYVMPSTLAYYAVDTPDRDRALVHDALQAAYNAGIDVSSFKFSMVVHAGNDKAMTRANGDIHSFTIQGYTFSPGPLTSYTISTAVVAESDPRGVFSHESGHLLGLPDLYDLTQRIDPTNNFVGYWEIMAEGEWNPNNGNPLGPQPGTYPSHMSVWSKIKLGFIPPSSIESVAPGEAKNITLQNLETPTAGLQAVKIPTAFNQDGTSTYYLLEMRAQVGTYDRYLPFATGYPGAGLLIYKVNESIPNGMGSVRLVNAHPGTDLSNAPFGPCSSPCVSNNTFWDQSNFVKIIVTSTTPSAYSVTVDRTSSPVLLLQVNTPASGIVVSIDGSNSSTDPSKQVRLAVRYGPHTIYVQPQIPISIGSTSVQVGLVNSFSSWNDGATSNPHGITVTADTVITATYRITAEPSAALAITAVAVLAVVVASVSLHRRKSHSGQMSPQQYPATAPPSPTSPPAPVGSLPRNNGLSQEANKGDQESKGA